MSELVAAQKELEEKKAPLAGGGEDAEAEGGGDDDAPVPEEECQATFTPLVKLEAVEVKTQEEDEDVVYVQRAKLFAFTEAMLDKGTGNKQWNEKGVGDVKILKHKEHSKIRLLMRQEKTMKIIANHFLDPRCKLEVSVGNDKSWVWGAFDYSDGQSLVDTTFAIRFKTVEIAGEFKEAFLKAQADNEALAAGLDSKEGGEEADAAAEAIAALSVSASATTESSSNSSSSSSSSPEKAASPP